MKKIKALLFSLAGQIIIFIDITFKREITGSYLVYTGICINSWQKCRSIRNAKIIFYTEPKTVISINNDNFFFSMDNVSVWSNYKDKL